MTGASPSSRRLASGLSTPQPDPSGLYHGLLAIGVDVGGTATKLGLIEAPGRVVDERETASDFPDAAALVDAITAETESWRRTHAGRIDGIGVAVPGLVDRRAGTVSRVPNLPVLEEMNVVEAVSASLSLPVVIDNDANAAGLAEAHLGAAAGADLAVCLTVGTGVGGAIIQGGRLWRGHRGYAGELGRVLIDPDGEVFFEDEVAAAAVVRNFEGAAGRIVEGIVAADVSQRAEEGDEAARRALAECGRKLGVGLAVLINLLNPDFIVVGGGVAGAGEWLLGPARAEAEARSWDLAFRDCQIVAAALGARAGVIGAALLTWHG